MSEKTEISQKLRNYVIENFSMEKFISEHEKLYLSLVKK